RTRWGSRQRLQEPPGSGPTPNSRLATELPLRASHGLGRLRQNARTERRDIDARQRARSAVGHAANRTSAFAVVGRVLAPLVRAYRAMGSGPRAHEAVAAGEGERSEFNASGG